MCAVHLRDKSLDLRPPRDQILDESGKIVELAAKLVGVVGVARGEGLAAARFGELSITKFVTPRRLDEPCDAPTRVSNRSRKGGRFRLQSSRPRA